jgi:precorrin-2 C20-methyltransferase/precorrin-3B C17-methyltransferase
LLEAVDQGPEAWRSLDIRIVPGVSAMQAAAARIGAPLGHDFCVLSLSDRLKPWDVIVKRLHAVASADFALAIYNPISSERTWQLAEARTILASYRATETPVVLARAVGRPDEKIMITNLGRFDPDLADMQTLILVGSSTTRNLALSNHREMIFTPRTYRF